MGNTTGWLTEWQFENEGAMKKVQLQQARNLPRLILHLDVNKTIVMADPVQKKWFERVCNDILCENVYGTMTKDAAGKDVFKCDLYGFRSSRFDLLAGDDKLSNYYEFVEKTFNRPTQFASYEERKKAKWARGQAKCTFTNPGQPGEIFANVYKEMLARMSLGDEEREKLEAAGIPVRGETEGTAYRFIVPAFFEMIIDLSKKGRQFAIVFRTFGTDMDNVQRELNLFCEGKHPCYPNVRFDGSGDSQDLRLYKENCGKIAYNMKPKPKLRWGTIRKPEDDEKQVIDSSTETIEGYRGVFHSIRSKAMKGITIGISDDYMWWHENNECADFGKLFLIEREDDSVHEMFFDDNLAKGDLTIVNCRDLKSFDPVPYKDAFRIYVDFANSYGIISDGMWFINAIEAMEKARQALL